jgi:cellobiose phosphorylase
MGFEAVREFRGVRYVVHVERRGPGNGVRLEVEGRPVAGTVVPLPPAGTAEVHVKVEVG